MVDAQEKEEREEPDNKMMYKKLVEFEEDENKENLETRLEEKKEEKKFRLNLKKGKTSLIVKKPVIL